MTDMTTTPAATNNNDHSAGPNKGERSRRRGPRKGGQGQSGPGQGGGRGRRGPQRNDAAPPRFDPMLLVELAGPALYQAVHPAVVKEVTDVAVFVQVTPEGHAPLRAAVPASDFGATPPVVESAIRVRLLNPATESESVPAASYRQARTLDLLADFEAKTARDERIDGTVVAEVKGGYTVQMGDDDVAIRAFAPRSQAIHPKLHHRADPVGETSPFVIQEFDRERMNIVVSRRNILDEVYESAVAERLASIKVGDIVEGTVRSIVDFGAFVDLGDGVDALLHVSDLSWDRVTRVSSVLRVGDHLKAKVVVCEPATRKVKIGLKQLIANPWEDLKATIKVGSEIEGDVVSLQDYGAFIRVADGVEGLVHVSEVSWERVRHVSQKLHIGDRVTAKVLDIDSAGRKLSLSIRALQKNPFEVVRDKYPAGTVLRVKVKNLSDFGAFVAVDDSVDGLIHVGEISWVEHVEHPSQVLTVGQEVEVVVLDVDVARQRVSCSMKQLTENPWKAWEEKYARGNRHTLKVTRVDNHGVTFETAEKDLVAVCGSRDAAADGERPSDVCKVGDEIEVEVKNLDRRGKRVVVSIKAVQERDVKAAYDEYKKAESGEQRTTLGDALKGKLAGVSVSSSDGEAS